MGGEAQVSGVAITVGPKTRIGAGELRFNQSGAGLFLLDGIFEATVIEALAPSGSLTARGKFFAGPSGCVGFSAGGTLDTSAASFDVPLTPNCP